MQKKNRMSKMVIENFKVVRSVKKRYKLVGMWCVVKDESKIIQDA